MDRRKVLKGIGLGIAGLPFISAKVAQPDIADYQNLFSEDQTTDEKFWKKFRKDFYDVPKDFINLENGYFGVQPKPVYEAYIKNIERVNINSSRYLRTGYSSDFKQIVNELSTFAGINPEEALITRNATEALNIAIQGLDWKEGDEVILSGQDYFSMIETFEMLEKQKGIKIKRIKIPLLPERDEEILASYEAAVTPKTKGILVTHMIHLTGQIMPIKKIADRFKPQGIEIIVDAAHSFAQIDFKLKDLGADFVGVNLHKWFGNPLGAGLLYVNRSRVKDLKPLFGDRMEDANDINKLGHFGTLSVPTVITIPEALAFNQTVTIPKKEKRLRYLQNYWTSKAKDIPSVLITTPLDPSRSCAIASFRIEGMETKEVITRLYEQTKVFTVIRYLEDQEVVRVTPSLYNLTSELDTLLEGIKSIT
ncbi:aminotransferase class V-fold PLP-dependent enzyme [Ekhidna sp. To15]|uniref:aminotransferase class V-fold PLP-dependent enzyme n=1 Tax=Ekhidna sp. To15 TaxID=3395267 RepID=UPI003F521DB7